MSQESISWLNTNAEIWVHGFPARDWEQVVQYINGDAHDRSKLQVLVDGKFYPLIVDQATNTKEK